ncbi:hypothetical protein D3C86_1602340 [compost metagenome]
MLAVEGRPDDQGVELPGGEGLGLPGRRIPDRHVLVRDADDRHGVEPVFRFHGDLDRVLVPERLLDGGQEVGALVGVQGEVVRADDAVVEHLDLVCVEAAGLLAVAPLPEGVALIHARLEGALHHGAEVAARGQHVEPIELEGIGVGPVGRSRDLRLCVGSEPDGDPGVVRGLAVGEGRLEGRFRAVEGALPLHQRRRIGQGHDQVAGDLILARPL